MVLRARRGGTGSKYVTFRGGLRRAFPYPPPRVKCGAHDVQPYVGRNGPAGMRIAPQAREAPARSGPADGRDAGALQVAA
jgi:hypothetical protein